MCNMKKTTKYQKLVFIIILINILILNISFSGSKSSFRDTALQLPSELKVIDTPNDAGNSICVTWKKSPTTGMGIYYYLYQSTNPEGPYEEIKKIDSRYNLMDNEVSIFGFSKKNKGYQFQKVKLERDKETKKFPETFYKIGIGDENTSPPLMLSQIASGIPKTNYFKFNKINNLIFLALMFIFVFYFINKAKKNPHIFLRKIAGLEAVEEAVGRSTEMGKPILYLTGAYDIDAISTISSINILSHVSKTVANYDSRIIIPCRYPVAMTVCQEVVRESYLNAGRIDHYNERDIFFIAGQQFSFTAAVSGVMMREKPAANFLLGTFGAESLILAETGAMTGAIQISGTDSIYQIPFFVVACDYCLIGEELYAASAYLSREPKLIGTLKAQDLGKILLVFLLVFGLILLSLGGDNFIGNSISHLLTPR